MQKIISTTPDESSLWRWSIRKADEEVVNNKNTVIAAEATNVVFKQSTISEEGFGGGLVAYCDKVKGIQLPPCWDKKKLCRLVFRDGSLVNAETNEVVKEVEILYLNNWNREGEMLAKIA